LLVYFLGDRLDRSLVELRHGLKYAALPWRIFGVGDRRRTFEDRSSLVENFLRMAICCIPPGLAHGLHQMTREQLLTPGWQTILFFAAWELALSLSVVEKLHARNRRNADPQMSWHNFATAFVNKEVRGLKRHDFRFQALFS
jgi:hypothetical protein